MSPPFAWGKYTWKAFHGWMDQLDKRLAVGAFWNLSTILRFLKAFGQLLPCPMCSQHFSMELAEQFDPATGKHPGPTYLQWSVDLRNRISKRVNGRIRTLAECTPTYDDQWYADAWHALQIITFAYPLAPSKDLQTETDWFFRTMVQVFPGQWQNPQVWGSIIDSQNQTSLVVITTGQPQAQAVVWCATRDKFAATVYKLRTEAQQVPKLTLPPLPQVQEAWEKEVNVAIAEFHRIHGLPPPGTTQVTPAGLKVVVPLQNNPPQRLVKPPNAGPTLPSRLPPLSAQTSAQPAVPLILSGSPLRPTPSAAVPTGASSSATTATPATVATNGGQAPTAPTAPATGGRQTQTQSAGGTWPPGWNSLPNRKRPQPLGPPVGEGKLARPMLKKAATDKGVVNPPNSPSSSSPTASSPTVSTPSFSSASASGGSGSSSGSGSGLGVGGGRWGRALFWTSLVLSVLLLVFIVWTILAFAKGRDWLDPAGPAGSTTGSVATDPKPTRVEVVGVEIRPAANAEQPTDADTSKLATEPAITVAPGSVYEPPEVLGEVKITTVPQSATQMPLTPAMIAEANRAGTARPRRQSRSNLSAGHWMPSPQIVSSSDTILPPTQYWPLVAETAY